MPVIRKDPRPSPRAMELLAELVAELKRNSTEPGSEDLPLILEDPERGTTRFGVTVLWEKWSDIPLRERGGLIMDAYKEVRGEPEMLRISRALGLTRAEADRLGIRLDG